MRGPRGVRAALFATIILLLLAQAVGASPERPAPSRIVSMSPGITSTLVALDLTDRVAGVTDWCDLPAEAGTVARIGGHIDPNYEAVLGLSPDLVIVETVNGEAVRRLEKLGLDYLEVDQGDIDGILESIVLIGEACGEGRRAAALTAEMRSKLRRIEEIAAREDGPRAMIVVGRDISTGRLRDLYAAGAATFLGELLARAGGSNIVPVHQIGYPTLSREAVLRLDPEVVLELAPELSDDAPGRERLLEAWNALPDVSAVRNRRVHIICDERLLVPGPHFLSTLEIFVETLFPGAYVVD